MQPIDRIRQNTLSAPNCTFWCGDPVFFRRGPAAPEERGRVVGRTLGPRPTYDIETGDGTLVPGVAIVRLDEETLTAQRAAQTLDGEAANGGS
ncbi:hypothetical protein SAMN05216257_104109 [Meinhardsimonia xiamenensis]|uniref:Uncharacterized protein n=2 Tax=Meinhardsimonia xiamenensis TaxID=990712 RepID=A0A1G9E1D2_9RHOB|nr:hypothetical protein LV81_02405 [Meinhardsimonia xiamenensis]SDK69890.1 hypothetical protein SAMN05216257_104109 [Meinhardsimonia xiamenensis]